MSEIVQYVSNFTTDLLGNPIAVVIVTLFFALICHRVLLNKFKADSAFWLVVDYGWLLLAVLGISLAYGEVRRINKQEAIDKQQTSVNVLHRETMYAASHSHEFLGGFGKHESKDSQWFGHLVSALELGAENPKWKHFLFQNDQLRDYPPTEPGVSRSKVPQFPTVGYERITSSSPSLVYENARQTIHRLEELKNATDELEILKNDAKPGKSLIFVRFIMPLLLTIGFGLRITKVTVDWKAKKNKGTVEPVEKVPPGQT